LQGLSQEDAIEVMKQEAMAAEELDAEEAQSDDEPDDLQSTVKKYLGSVVEVAEDSKDAVHDFNLKVRFQGHVESTPPDHLACLLELLFGDAVGAVNLDDAKLKPNAVAKAAAPVLEKWTPLLEGLYSKIDVMEAADLVVQMAHKVPTGKPAAVVAAVGCLMAVQEIDIMEDSDLQTACKRLEPRSKVLEGFIEFLNDDDSSDED